MAENNLIILGNGFDLATKYKSTFGDFFDTFNDLDEYKSAKQLIDDLSFKYKDGISDTKNEERITMIIDDDRLNIKVNPILAFPEENDYHKMKVLAKEISMRNFNEVNINKMISDIRENDETISDINVGELKHSFWGIWFLILKGENLRDWSAVEEQLTNFFREKLVLNKGIGLERITATTTRYKTLFKLISIYSGLDLEISSIKVDYIDFILLKYFIKYNPEVIDNKEFDLQMYNDLLMKQLNQFEKAFAFYLNDMINNTNSFIDTARDALITKLGYKTGLNSILNFNYTKIDGVLESDVRHIHGSLENENIIFGIDSNDLDYSEDYYMFTKTYRIMADNQGNHVDIFLNNEDVDNIIFFGQSLSESDYSYFQSIFDHYNIYDNKKIKLIFYSLIFEEKIEDQIKKDQYDHVGTLLDEYSKTIPDKRAQKNLMHKLLLENRLSVINLSVRKAFYSDVFKNFSDQEAQKAIELKDFIDHYDDVDEKEKPNYDFYYENK